MNTSVLDPTIKAAFAAIQTANQQGATKTIQVDGQPKQIPYPFPSPAWLFSNVITTVTLGSNALAKIIPQTDARPPKRIAGASFDCFCNRRKLLAINVSDFSHQTSILAS